MRRMALGWLTLIFLLQGCATASLDVGQERPPSAPTFTTVAVPPFANGVGAALPAPAPEEVAGAIIATLQKDYPSKFRDVSAVPSNVPGELIVRGTIDAYDPGSKAARFLLIGLSPGDLKLRVTVIDAQSGATLESFSTDGAIVAGGVAGASMGIEDMINSAAEKIAERVAAYGQGG